MTVLVGAARRRDVAPDPDFPLPPATDVAPYGPVVECDFPIPAGRVGTIHPSVVDMKTKWNGYRWWCANTPMPDDVEDPTIYGSNDRVNWTPIHAGAAPIDVGYEGPGTYNSDNMLVWDSANSRLVCFFRWYGSSTNLKIRARTSTDGVTWSDRIEMFSTSTESMTAPAVVPAPEGGWWMVSTRRFEWYPYWSAPDLLGPWTKTAVTGTQGQPYNHGSILRLASGVYISVGPIQELTSIVTKRSTDGLNWSAGGSIGLGVMSGAYMASMALSTKAGWVDIWVSSYTTNPACRTYYTRAPLSLWGV